MRNRHAPSSHGLDFEEDLLLWLAWGVAIAVGFGKPFHWVAVLVENPDIVKVRKKQEATITLFPSFAKRTH